MTLQRSFVIRDSKVEDALHAFIRMNAKAMYESKHPMEVICREYKPKATDPQRALIWIINEQIAKQAWFAGRQFDAETIHEYCKRDLLPDICEKGVEKWRYLPGGDRVLQMSTEDLNRAEKADYITALLAFAAEQGVEVEIEARIE